MPNKKHKKKKQHNRYLALTSISFQMGITIYLGSYIGGALDEKYNTEENYYTTIFVLLSVVISIYTLIKQVKKINND